MCQSSHFRLPERPGDAGHHGRPRHRHRALPRLPAAAPRGARHQGPQSWLFFGDRHAATDFLFRDEIEAWQADGTLSRLSLAWSRDGKAKDYVQHRMREESPPTYGAGCRMARISTSAAMPLRMAKDVDAALRHRPREGGMDADQARDWIVALARQGRYQRDVY
jgi:sulfite reductase (NADPH) flavoprotein alpha-component